MSDVSIGLVCRSPVRPSEVFAEGLGFQHYRGPHVRQFAEIVGRLEIRRAIAVWANPGSDQATIDILRLSS